MIRLENIVKTYDKREILKGINLELPSKGIAVIHGKSGSGKSTLLNIVGGLDKCDRGKVFIKNQELNSKNQDMLRRNVGFIFQNYNLEDNYTVNEILINQMKIAGFKDQKEITKRISESLELVGLTRFANRKADFMSGGQRQRVAIARAIIKGSDIILADEPTGNLDSQNTKIVMDILQEISKTRLVVLVTHEDNIANEYADVIVEIVDGQIKEVIDNSSKKVVNKNILGANILSYSPSQQKITGRVFSFKTFFYDSKRNEFSNSNRDITNIIKICFILFLAVLFVVFSQTIFKNLKNINEYKMDSTKKYIDFNSYNQIKYLDSSKYKNLSLESSTYNQGKFFIKDLINVDNVKVDYIPQSVDILSTDKASIVNNIKKSGDIVISNKVYNDIIKKIRNKDITSNNILSSLVLNNKYNVVGVINDNMSNIYFRHDDYINFLGSYKYITFVDENHIFFNASNGQYSYKSFIAVEDDYDNLYDDEVALVVNRNSAYKMILDPIKIDVAIYKANQLLNERPKTIQLYNSNMFVKKIESSRDLGDFDIAIRVSRRVLKNIFKYIYPNMDAYKTTQDLEKDLPYNASYMLSLDPISDNLDEEILENNITCIDPNIDFIERTNIIIKDNTIKNSMPYFIAIVLLIIILYFIERTQSLKKIKQYGIFRALGVKTTNIMYHESLRSVVTEIIPFTLLYIFASTISYIIHAIANIPLFRYHIISLIVYLVSIFLIYIASIMPYIYLFKKTPSQILVKYDI